MLILKDIKFRYGQRQADFNIDVPILSFQNGLVTCVLGTNGSGKTTILNLIGGHLLPNAGKIQLNDVEITNHDAARRPISTVFQQIGLFPHLSVRQNIEMAIEPNALFKVSKKTREKAQNVLEDFDVAFLADRKPNALSIGQQQKIAICRSLSSSPNVLLLDEPTSALDFANIKVLKDLLKEIKSTTIVPIIIIVSHDLNFVMDVADHIKYIEQGKFTFQGTSTDFQNSIHFIN